MTKQEKNLGNNHDSYALRHRLLTKKLKQLEQITNPSQETLKVRNRLLSVLEKIDAMQKHTLKTTPNN